MEETLARLDFDARRLATLGSAPTKPLLTHERFRIAISGCPNCCAQPQIRDFGLFARQEPALDTSLCIGCGACEAACEEDAITVGTGDTGETSGRDEFALGRAIISMERCVGCGACIRVCPTDALSPARSGWTVLVGGKLGRHPRLAETVAEWTTDEEAAQLLAAAAEFFLREARPRERFGSLLERTGASWLKDLQDYRTGEKHHA